DSGGRHVDRAQPVARRPRPPASRASCRRRDCTPGSRAGTLRRPRRASRRRARGGLRGRARPPRARARHDRPAL
ncbi:MAG: FIG00820006: hypothetical protein, partial [uncultured Blastococcus sp.]